MTEYEFCLRMMRSRLDALSLRETPHSIRCHISTSRSQLFHLITAKTMNLRKNQLEIKIPHADSDDAREETSETYSSRGEFKTCHKIPYCTIDWILSGWTGSVGKMEKYIIPKIGRFKNREIQKSENPKIRKSENSKIKKSENSKIKKSEN